MLMYIKLNPERTPGRGGGVCGPVLGTLAFAALALAAGWALRATQAFPEAIVEARERDSNPVEVPQPQAVPAQPEAVPTPPLEQTVRGVKIAVSNPRLEGGVAKLDVCREMPGPGHWIPLDTVFQIGEKRITDRLSAAPILIRGEPIDGRQLVTTWADGKDTEEWQPAAPGARALRCDTFSFAIDAAAARPLRFEFRIGALLYLPDEGTACQVYLTTVQSALDALGSGIVLACTQEEWGENVTIKEFPSTMTQAQAEELAFSLDYFKFHGPWTFYGTFE